MLVEVDKGAEMWKRVAVMLQSRRGRRVVQGFGVSAMLIQCIRAVLTQCIRRPGTYNCACMHSRPLWCYCLFTSSVSLCKLSPSSFTEVSQGPCRDTHPPACGSFLAKLKVNGPKTFPHPCSMWGWGKNRDNSSPGWRTETDTFPSEIIPSCKVGKRIKAGSLEESVSCSICWPIQLLYFSISRLV